MTNCVTEIIRVKYNEVTRSGIVDAIVENFSVVYPATYDDPCEMGPAMCTAEFFLHEEEEIPDDEGKLAAFFDDKDLRWEEIDDSDCYCDD